MFRVDRSQNRLSRLVQIRFSDLRIEAVFSEPLARLKRQIRIHNEQTGENT
jgi:hypothetical protein